MPRLHVAWVQVTAGLGFFLHSSRLSDSEDSDSLLYLAGLLEPSPQVCTYQGKFYSYSA